MTQSVRTTDWRANPLPVIIPGTSQTVSVGASSVQSTAVGALTTVVRLVSSVDCFIAIGSSPTASTGSAFLPAGMPECFGCTEKDKIAVIQSSTGGTLYITEGA